MIPSIATKYNNLTGHDNIGGKEEATESRQPVAEPGNWQEELAKDPNQLKILQPPPDKIMYEGQCKNK